ncbi:1058_t:CDS:2 [Acaulospora colombiana]|uniref:1058_t:CDS:1 n=1 Tax=Acaulospora colombiana TaxID=27376 RepID=A0ACA9K006_9GLOM|nr:1058_t:CDS:2 [Acaulospora colombiana]
MDSPKIYYTYQSPVFFGYNPDGRRRKRSTVQTDAETQQCTHNVLNTNRADENDQPTRPRNVLRQNSRSRRNQQNITVGNLSVSLFDKDNRGSSSNELARRAAAFAHSYPPSDALPNTQQVDQIISQKGYEAWKFVLDRMMIDGNGMPSISSEGRVVEFGAMRSVEEEKRREAVSSGTEFMHYFEITLISRSKYVENMAIGLTTRPYPYFRFPGWNMHSVGYHSRDGSVFHENIDGKRYGPSWGDEIGETVGVGYRPNTGEVFFTKNGEYLGVTLKNSKHVWYPTVAADGPCKFEINFGDKCRGFRFEKARNYGPGAPLKED